MLSGARPWLGKPYMQVMFAVVQKKATPAVPAGLSPVLEALLERCFAYAAVAWPSSAEVAAQLQAMVSQREAAQAAERAAAQEEADLAALPPVVWARVEALIEERTAPLRQQVAQQQAELAAAQAATVDVQAKLDAAERSWSEKLTSVGRTLQAQQEMVVAAAAQASQFQDQLTELKQLGLAMEPEPAALALGLSAEDARRVGALVPQRTVSEAALKFDHCGEGVQRWGTDTCTGGGAGGWEPAAGGEPLDPSDGPVYRKATLVECKSLMLGVTGNAQVENNGYLDPPTFCWYSSGAHVHIAGKNTSGHGGWAAGSPKKGDICVFKLEAHQLSLRVQRLGAQTFTVPTNGVRNRRAFYNRGGNRVQLAQAGPGEEY